MFFMNSSLRKFSARPLVKWACTSMTKYSPLGHFSAVASGSKASASSTSQYFAVDFVGGEEAGGQAHGAGHELAAVHAELFGVLVGHGADEVLHLFLLLRFAGGG